jgi:hypothetical protein
MIGAAFAFFIVTNLAFVGLCKPFIDALKEEAPSVYASMGRPTVSQYVWRRQLMMPFSKMILDRTYRGTLVDYPRSRAWASWVFLAHWVQLIAVALLAVVIAWG